MKRYLLAFLFLFVILSSYGQNNVGLKKGFKGVFEPAYQVGVGEYGLDRFKANLIYGYQFNPYVSIGVGTGLRYYFDESNAFTPLLFNLKINFLDRKVSPYFSFSAGYNFSPFSSFVNIGYLFNPAVGVCIRIYEKSALYLGFEIEVQQKEFINYYDLYFGYTNEIKNSYSMSLNLGITF